MPASFWVDVRDQSRLWTLDEAERHFETLYGDAEPYMQQLVRVFLDDDTFAPAYQFLNGELDPRVLTLFERALELKVPHNAFSVWMLTPLPGRNSPRPAAALEHPERLMEYLEAFARNRP